MDLQCIILFPTRREEELYREAIETSWLSDLRRYYCGERLKVLCVVGGGSALTTTKTAAGARTVPKARARTGATLRLRTERITNLMLMGLKQVIRPLRRHQKKKSTQILALPYNIYPNLYRLLTGNLAKVNAVLFPFLSRANNLNQKVFRDLNRCSFDTLKLKNLNPDSHHNLRAISEALYWTIKPQSSDIYQVFREIFYHQYGNYLFDLIEPGDGAGEGVGVEGVDEGEVEGEGETILLTGSIVKKIRNRANNQLLCDRPILLQTFRSSDLGKRVGIGSDSDSDSDKILKVLMQELPRGLPTDDYSTRYLRFIGGGEPKRKEEPKNDKWVTDIREASTWYIKRSKHIGCDYYYIHDSQDRYLGVDTETLALEWGLAGRVPPPPQPQPQPQPQPRPRPEFMWYFDCKKN